MDAGERHAIQLAKDENADLLLMDERIDVRVARERGLMVTGTLGVLLQGASAVWWILTGRCETCRPPISDALQG
ncbi:MAG TPA: hypothetical protein VNY05_12255 [Candidatus Acidoferrales bacterium]|nr:hypothetical protein [Candidatus Acidoferrales bacterium]